MSWKNLSKSESAAAIAIAAVLLLGLAFTLISVVKLNYAPEWKINAERDYSYDAWSNMEEVKTRAEIFTRFMESDPNYPYGLSATVPFSMGGGDVPVFEPSKSNSKLAVNTEECTMNITFGNHTLDPVHCGGITYYSENRQYPNQIFRYENGALILAQGENSQMKRDPLFNIKKNMSNYNYTVTINAINLTGDNAINLTGEPESISSSTLTGLRLTGCLIDPVLNTDVYTEAEGAIETFNLSISTHYTDAWTTYLNNTAKDAGLKYGVNYTINSTDDYVHLSFLPTGNNYSIYVNQTVLCAEIGRKVGGEALPGEVLPGGSGNVMEMDRWYNFTRVSDSGVDLSKFEHYGSGADFSADLTKNDDILNPYTSNNEFQYDIQANPLELTFGFNGFTGFESKPKSATIRMIYYLNYNGQSGNTQVAGNNLDFLTGSKNNWYLYNETTSINITDPSELTFYLKMDKQTSNANIKIDYLAVRLD